MKSLYVRLVEAGIETDHHESDLYVAYSEQAFGIARAWAAECKAPVKMKFFVSPIDGRQWIEFPFLYDPFWEAQRRSSLQSV